MHCYRVQFSIMSCPKTAIKPFYGFCILLTILSLTRMTQTATGFTKLGCLWISLSPSSSLHTSQRRKSLWTKSCFSGRGDLCSNSTSLSSELDLESKCSVFVRIQASSGILMFISARNQIGMRLISNWSTDWV